MSLETLYLSCLLEAGRMGICPVETPFDKKAAKTILSISERSYRTAVRSGDLEFSINYGAKTGSRIIFHNMFDLFRFEILRSADTLKILEQCNATADSLVDAIARYADIFFYPICCNEYDNYGGRFGRGCTLLSWLKDEYGMYADPLTKSIRKIDIKIGNNLALLGSGLMVRT